MEIPKTEHIRIITARKSTIDTLNVPDDMVSALRHMISESTIGKCSFCNEDVRLDRSSQKIISIRPDTEIICQICQLKEAEA
jgi:hypothetical protein